MNAIAEMPLYLAQMAPRARVPSTTYVPPPLQANGLGWYPEFNKVWEWFGKCGVCCLVFLLLLGGLPSKLFAVHKLRTTSPIGQQSGLVLRVQQSVGVVW